MLAEQGHVNKGEEVLARNSPAHSNFDKNDLKEKQIRETYRPIVNINYMGKRMKDKRKRRDENRLCRELKSRKLTSQVMDVIEKQQKIQDIMWELHIGPQAEFPYLFGQIFFKIF